QCAFEVVLQLLGQHPNVRFLEHAGVSAWDVEHPDTSGRTAFPAKQWIVVAFDVRLVVATTARGSEQNELSVESPSWLVVLFGEQVHRSHGDTLKESRQAQASIQMVAEEPHSDFIPQARDLAAHHVDSEILGLARGFRHDRENTTGKPG